MYHSVNFIQHDGSSMTYGPTKNTYSDWGLVPDSRPVIALPEVVTNTVEVPGMSGLLDLSEYLTGYPTYKNRSGSLHFIALPNSKSWVERFTEIATFVHGKDLTMILEDDPNYYYSGRFKMTWESNNDGNGSTVNIDYDLMPFKYRKQKFSQTINLSSTSTYVDICNKAGIASLASLLKTYGNATPVVPTVSVKNRTTSSISMYCSNPELGLGSSNSSHEITITNKKVKYYDCLLSNLNGENSNLKLMMMGAGTVLVEFDYCAF